MDVIIKIDLEQRLANGVPLIIELGSGMTRIDGRINIDKKELQHVDIVADIENGLPFLPDCSVDEIHSTSFFEHITDLEGVLREIVRVLKKNGKCFVFVPHFSNPYFYSDYTHHNFMGLYTFYYFVDTKYQLSRKVPDFYSDIRIKILYQHLVIANPSKKRKFIKRSIGFIFNLNTAMQEFYEENLCYIFPCYGLKIVFSPDK